MDWEDMSMTMQDQELEDAWRTLRKQPKTQEVLRRVYLGDYDAARYFNKMSRLMRLGLVHNDWDEPSMTTKGFDYVARYGLPATPLDI